MAVDAFDQTTGAPIFLETGAPEIGADNTAVAEFAASVGTRLIGTSTQREAYEFQRRGLAWFDTTLGREFLHDGESWKESYGYWETDFVATFNTAYNGG